ncbi:prolyl oligopeptidase family serine peptidase [Dyella sp. A6]|uniref:prolyl oligopeptidase family serine peptidase n=1 Tax=Dyella aluminiiresistens TaxID=3069105 RepID=UPI002E776587|nr:prolyl oligopeptidase family serine peptidase [Dyella sp. A6]
MVSKYAIWITLALGATLAGMNPTHAATTGSQAAGNDPYLWLEATHGQRAMAWVKGQNAITEKAFADSPEFTRSFDRILQVLNSDARIPYVHRMGDYLYNFWQDKAHPRGIWRRTTLAEYRRTDPHWETLLDIDALNKAEDKRWVFKGAQCLKPAYVRCLVSLSPDGGDAVEVREFDLATKSFVKDGFHLPLAKNFVNWIDRDHIYVGTDFGPGSMARSSYPRIVKEWTRGTPLAAARLVYEASPDDLSVSAWHDRTPGYERDFVSVATDFFHSENFLRKNGKLEKLDIPGDAGFDAHRQWLLVQTRSAWTVGGKTWPSGALLAIKFDDFMAGRRDFTALFTPDAHTALSGYAWTRHHLIIDVLDDVKSRLDVLTPQPDGRWLHQALPGAPSFSTISVADTDPDHSDEYWLSVTGFLTPSSLERGVLGEGPAETIKQEPAFFDASKFVVSQHFVTSKDGTRVPYFEIAPKGMKLDGSHRTLLYGYGGFEISLLPYYSGSIGRAWLSRGGVYVVANIRGGGEYGPRWHQAALKANRPKAYQDFAAVAEDLIRRGVTSAKHLGAEGGSNGGLLVGNMLTEYPQLFGAIACEVPLLDMKRYTHLSAGASWIAEYGNPDDPKQWAFIKTFSPYQNVKKGTDYPPVLFYTTTSDDRVGPAQARKMAAKMEGMGYRKVWFYENTEGGHGAGADNRQSAHMHAMVYNFLWNELK